MRLRGITLLESLAAVICVSVLLAATLQGFTSLENAFSNTTGQTSVQGQASDAVKGISDSLRRATACTKNHGCGSQDGAALLAAGPKDVTINGVTPGQAIRYWEENGNVYRSGPSGTDLVAEGASLLLTYYEAGKHNTDDLVPVTPNSSDLPQIIAVDVAITATVGRASGAYSTTVRLRNSPATTDDD